jgi:tetratricopeptide (TPR) repeat protein
VGQPEVLGISRGVASYKVDDHFAILGVAIDTDATQIRRKFLKIAKILHPDVAAYSPAEKELATKYFAKLVSPAYQILTDDRERAEYFIALRHLAQALKQSAPTLKLRSELARQFLQHPHPSNYLKAVSEIANLQYRSLDKLLDYTADLSELNLVYLMTQETLSQTSRSTSHSQASEDETIVQDPSQLKVERGMQLAEMYISKKLWTEAMVELKTLTKLAPNNSKAHALMGVVYTNQNLAVMAKTCFQKALNLDPKNPIALKYMNQGGGAQPKVASASAKQPPKKDEKKGGGWFGWGKK